MPKGKGDPKSYTSEDSPGGPAYEYCRCDWMKDVEALQDCGCGRDGHQVRLYRDHVVHWKGRHWRIECAFEDAVTMLRLAP